MAPFSATCASAALLLLLLLASSPGALGAAPRGANTWDAEPNTANETQILAAAAYMRDVLLPFGYDTLTLDGGWYNNASGMVLDAFGRPYPNTALFPSAADGRGLKSLAERVNAMGIRLGAWTIRGVPRQAVELDLPIFNSSFTARDAAVLDRNCSWDAQILGTNAPSAAADAWYASIAQLYLDYGLSFVKIDCMWPGSPGGQRFDEDVVAFATAFSARAPGIPISWSPGDGMTPTNGSWIAERGGAFGVMYRVTPDFHDDSWPRLKAHLATAASYAPLIGLGGTYPDLDMLPVGNQSRGSGNAPSPCLFSHDEQRLLMTLWCIARAPLIIGAVLPLDADDTWTLGLLTNTAALAVNSATRANAPVALAVGPSNATDLWAWTALPDDDVSGTHAIVAIFNAQDEPVAELGIALPPAGVLPAACFRATDIWSGQSLPGTFSGTFSVPLNAHASGLYRLQPC
jgi:hypothetical protein